MDPKDINFDNLGFNFIKTKEMFISVFKDGGWDDGKIVPFEPIELSPAAGILNYGQGIFEGMKALRAKTGEITIFRPEENAKRFSNSAKRLMMPSYDIDKFLKAIKEVVKANEDYIPPYETGGALYLRPILFGSGPILGVAPTNEYMMIIFAVPVGPYFPEGFKAIDLEITKNYTRPDTGGTGDTKTGCNYAGTLEPAKKTKQKGFAQVVYLDAINKKYIEEVGTANFFAIIDGKLATPKLGTILPGITRKSVLEIAEKKLNLKVEERNISYDELFQENCTEAFCTGTAAVITPIGSVSLESKKRLFNDRNPGEYTKKLYDLLTGIQRLKYKDEFDWIMKI